MKIVLFLPQRDFKDETAAIVKLIFRKWGVQCDIASYGKNCVGMHGAVYKADISASAITSAQYDGIILADGKGIDDQKVFDYRPLLDTINLFNNAKKPIISVGNAVKIPARANIIRGKKAVVVDDETKRLVVLFNGIPSKDGIEAADNIITVKDAKAFEEYMDLILQRIGVS